MQLARRRLGRRSLGPLALGGAAALLASCGSSPTSSPPATSVHPPAPRMILVRGEVADVAFDDATSLYSVTPSTLLRVRGDRGRPLRRAGRNVTLLGLSPDAETLVEQRRTERGVVLRAVRWRSGTLLWEIPFKENPDETAHVSWSADGRRFAIDAGGRTNVWIVDRASGRVVRRAKQTGYLGRQPFTPDGRTLALNTMPARLLDVQTGASRRIGPRDGLDRAAWSPDGATIAAAGSDGMLLVDVRTGRTRTLPITTMIPAWSPDGRMIAVFRMLSRAYDVGVFEVATGRLLTHRRFTNGFESSALAWSPDGRRLAFTES